MKKNVAFGLTVADLQSEAAGFSIFQWKVAVKAFKVTFRSLKRSVQQ